MLLMKTLQIQGLKWRDLPGEKLIHYVHCSAPLPTSRPGNVLMLKCMHIPDFMNIF